MSFQAMAWAVQQKTGDALGRALLLTLANYANDEGKCWPSLSRLAEDCEMHRATVIRKLEALREKGLISREQRETPAGTYNVYTLSLSATPSRTERLPLVAECDPPSRTERPKPISEPIKAEPITPTARRRAVSDDDFEAFYAAYPRHVGRQAARKAYERAVKKGAKPEDILAGAKRYATQVAGKDQTYVKHPSTWLNAEAWVDDAPRLVVVDRPKSRDPKSPEFQAWWREHLAKEGAA